MKKLVALVLALVMVMGMTAWAEEEKTAPEPIELTNFHKETFPKVIYQNSFVKVTITKEPYIKDNKFYMPVEVEKNCHCAIRVSFKEMNLNGYTLPNDYIDISATASKAKEELYWYNVKEKTGVYGDSSLESFGFILSISNPNEYGDKEHVVSQEIEIDFYTEKDRVSMSNHEPKEVIIKYNKTSPVPADGSSSLDIYGGIKLNFTFWSYNFSSESFEVALVVFGEDWPEHFVVCQNYQYLKNWGELRVYDEDNNSLYYTDVECKYYPADSNEYKNRGIPSNVKAGLIIIRGDNSRYKNNCSDILNKTYNTKNGRISISFDLEYSSDVLPYQHYNYKDTLKLDIFPYIRDENGAVIPTT